MTSPRQPKFKKRDDFVRVICNFLLRHVASKDYEKMIDGSIRLGMLKAAELTLEDV